MSALSQSLNVGKSCKSRENNSRENGELGGNTWKDDPEKLEQFQAALTRAEICVPLIWQAEIPGKALSQHSLAPKCVCNQINPWFGGGIKYGTVPPINQDEEMWRNWLKQSLIPAPQAVCNHRWVFMNIPGLRYFPLELFSFCCAFAKPEVIKM